MVGLVSLAVLVAKRGRTWAAKLQRKGVVLPQAGGLPIFTPEAGYEFTGIRAKILSAYTSGFEAVQKLTGIPMTPYTTLREFLEAVTPRLPAIIQAFALLTIIAETALYSAHIPGEAAAIRARQLAANIREALHGTA